MPLHSARAKLLDPDLGALTPDEIAALIAATAVDAPKTHGALTDATIEQILDIAAEYPRDKAKHVLLELFKDRISIAIEKTWTDTDMQSIA